ncbi:MAG: rhomboid family intramembrane serine protease [Blastocatellia bacterium]
MLFFFLYLFSAAVSLSIPISHNRQVVRRKPVVTITLIILNTLCFSLTILLENTNGKQYEKALADMIAFREARESALYCENPVQLSPEARQRLGRLPEYEITSDGRIYGPAEETGGKRDPLFNDGPDRFAAPGACSETTLALEEQNNQEMTRLSATFVSAFDNHWRRRFTFIPAEHKLSLFNFLACLFVHASLMHLIGNMLYLYLTGLAVENAWGRTFTVFFYLLSGIVATTAHALTNPYSKTPLVGASGAIAGLMAAFLLQYLRASVRLLFLPGFILGAAGAFLFSALRASARLVTRARGIGYVHLPAYVIFPIWLGMDVLGVVTVRAGQGGIAHWAHLGGFSFGLVVAFVVRCTGMDTRLRPRGFDRNNAFNSDLAVTEAVSHLELGEAGEAYIKLQHRLAVKPHDLEAMRVMALTCQRLGQGPAALAWRQRYISALLRAGQPEMALHAWHELLGMKLPGAAGTVLPPRDWMALCEFLERRNLLADAAREYEQLWRTYSHQPYGAEALLRFVTLSLQHTERNMSLPALDRIRDLLFHAILMEPAVPGWPGRVADLLNWQESIRARIPQTFIASAQADALASATSS